MAINIFIAVLEYYLFVACVGILLPFGLVSGTKFLAEKAIGAVVAVRHQAHGPELRDGRHRAGHRRACTSRGPRFP